MRKAKRAEWRTAPAAGERPFLKDMVANKQTEEGSTGVFLRRELLLSLRGVSVLVSTRESFRGLESLPSILKIHEC